MDTGTAVVWLRDDLRLADNPALAEAAREHAHVAPVFVWSPADAGAWRPGSTARAWLAASLTALRESVASLGGILTIESGPTAETLLDFARATGATTVLWNRRYEPALAALDNAVAIRLAAAGLRVRVMRGSVLTEPDAIATTGGGPYQVFTPFFNTALTLLHAEAPLPAPARIAPPDGQAEGASPAVVAAGARAWPVAEPWMPGETGAQRLADRFFDDLVAGYAENRDRPDIEGTSRLSPHLAFGEISARELVARANRVIECNGSCHVSAGATAFIRQLFWRDFAYHLLHHFPHTPERPLRRRFDVFPWSRDPRALEAWQHGMTGFPIVDAGMRELLETGWMHNRVRMIVASFLTKDLLLPWTEGAAWFWEHLIDADLANNTFGWQWVAGCGADAAPYFRIFNPVVQSERFDPDGTYVKRWVPELEGLPSGWVHRPWSAPSGTLSSAGVALGTTYPEPVVDHAAARLRALAVYGSIRDIAG